MDPSRALGDCVPQWADLEDVQKTILSEWYEFFRARYNIVRNVGCPTLAVMVY